MIAAGYNHMTQILSRYLKIGESHPRMAFVIVSQLQSCYNKSMKNSSVDLLRGPILRSL